MAPQTRKEISSIGWIHLVDLPGYSKKNKQAHPGIKLYMVTPFLSGLRKWISQNRHMKGKLIPAEEDGLLEDVIQDEVMQNDTTDDLIAMLGRPQPPEQEVDLLGMLRNGNTSQSHYQVPRYPKESYSPQDAMSYTFQQPSNGQQMYDLMKFSPKIEPTRDSVQELPEPPGNPIHPIIQQRQENLLSILKGDPLSEAITKTKSANVSLLDLLKSPQSKTSTPASVRSVQQPKSQHQQSLLSMLKSPKLSSTTPPIQNKAPTTSLPSVEEQPSIDKGLHQNGFLSNLNSPHPLSTLPSTESHQHALLSTLKSNLKPPNRPHSPRSTVAPSPVVLSHQNSLLEALKSPKLGPQTDHRTSPLGTLKQPPAPNPSPKRLSIAPSEGGLSNQSPKLDQQTDHEMSFLASLKEQPPCNPCPAPVSAASPETAASKETKVDTASNLATRVTSPLIPRVIPTPAHRASLLSALKSPTLHTTTSTLPAPTASSAGHSWSLLSALKNPSTALSPVEKEDKINELKKTPGEVPNVHMESLLKTLRGPSASPVLEKIAVEKEKGSKEDKGRSAKTDGPKIATAISMDDGVKESLGAPKVITPLAGSDHVNVLLPTLKGIDKTNKSFFGDDKKGTPTVPEANFSTKPIISSATTSGVTVVRRPLTTVNSLLDTLKAKPKVSPPPPPAAAPTANQNSNLSLFNPSVPRTQSPSSKSSPTPQQFNFSPTPQVGKRIKFRQTLVPGGGIKGYQPERKTNGTTIDLGKVTLLKRPTPEPPAPIVEIAKDKIETKRMGAKPAETEEVTYLNEEPPQSKESVSSKGMSQDPRKTTSEPQLLLPNTEELTQSDNSGTIHTETSHIIVLKRPEATKQYKVSKPESGALETKPESPLGIEFPFQRRTPSKGSHGSPTPTTTPTGAHSQSLLALLKGPAPEIREEETVDRSLNVELETKNVKPSLASVVSERGAASEEIDQLDRSENMETLGTEREMKLIAMLERAFARGVPS